MKWWWWANWIRLLRIKCAQFCKDVVCPDVTSFLLLVSSTTTQHIWTVFIHIRGRSPLRAQGQKISYLCNCCFCHNLRLVCHLWSWFEGSYQGAISSCFYVSFKDTKCNRCPKTENIGWEKRVVYGVLGVQGGHQGVPRGQDSIGTCRRSHGVKEVVTGGQEGSLGGPMS